MTKLPNQEVLEGKPLDILLNEAMMGIMPFDDYYYTSKPDVILSPVVDHRLEIGGYYHILTPKRVTLSGLTVSAKFNPKNINEKSISQLIFEGVNKCCGYPKSFSFGKEPNADLYLAGGNVTVKFDNELPPIPHNQFISAKVKISEIAKVAEDYKKMCDILGVKYTEKEDELWIYNSMTGPNKKQVLEGINYLHENNLKNINFSTSKSGISSLFTSSRGFSYSEEELDDGTIQSKIKFSYGSSHLIESIIFKKEKKLNHTLSFFNKHLNQKTEFDEWQATYNRRMHYREPIDLR